MRILLGVLCLLGSALVEAEWVVANNSRGDDRPLYACDATCVADQKRGSKIGRTGPELLTLCEGPLSPVWTTRGGEWQFTTNPEGLRGVSVCVEVATPPSPCGPGLVQACVTACQWDPTIPASDLMCVDPNPPVPCPWDPNIPDTDPACIPPPPVNSPPPAPSTFEAASSDNPPNCVGKSLTICNYWPASVDPDGDQVYYTLYRDGAFLVELPFGTLSYDDTNLMADQAYNYCLEARDEHDAKAPQICDAGRAKDLSTPLIVETLVNFQAMSHSVNEVIVTWGYPTTGIPVTCADIYRSDVLQQTFCGGETQWINTRNNPAPDPGYKYYGYAVAADGTRSAKTPDSFANPGAPPPTIILTVADSVVNVGDTTTLTWSTVDADQCTASAGWSGAKALSGSEVTAAITADTTFSLDCSGPGGSSVGLVMVQVMGQVNLSWIAPTQNVDGSPLTDLSGYKVYWGDTSRNYTSSDTVNDASALSHTVSLPTGSYYFAITALDSQGSESAFSNEVVKQSI